MVVVQDAPTRYAGLAWLIAGFIFYLFFRRHLQVPLTQTMRAPVPLGPALALEYRSILVPVISGPQSHEAVEVAVRLAAERAGRIVLLRVIVVPLELPLDADLGEQTEEANRLLDEATALAAVYGVRTVERVVRARHAGRAIVQRGRAPRLRDRRARRAPRRPQGDLRQDGRLRPEVRAVPRDGRRRQAGRMTLYRRSVALLALVFIALGVTMVVVTLVRGGGVGVILGGLFVALGVGRLLMLRRKSVVARKLPGFRRELDARALFSVAYGEIASSIYFALGVLAAHALGFTPLVLLAVGLLFLVVSLSYAEGTAAIPETGGAATFVRRAYNDLAGFLTGWALGLDYLIVIALSALFIPHYLAGAFQVPALDHNPWDVVFGVARDRPRSPACGSIRRPSLYGLGIVVPALDLITQLLLVVLGFVFVFSGNALTHGMSLGHEPTWHALAFSLPLAMLAFTGLETVANLAEEARRPGVDLPRSVFGGIATVISVYVLIALVAVSAFPGPNTELGNALDPLAAPRHRRSASTSSCRARSATSSAPTSASPAR